MQSPCPAAPVQLPQPWYYSPSTWLLDHVPISKQIPLLPRTHRQGPILPMGPGQCCSQQVPTSTRSCPDKPVP